jgi:isoquinoline 1-oxidoreductase beta subunit
LRDLPANAESDPPRSDVIAGEQTVIASRRTFLKTAALGGASLVIGFDRWRLFAAEEKKAVQFKPNGWVRIDPDGTVTLTIGKSEMGQGVRTSLAMILAEELEADWSRIKLVQASPGPEFKRLGTGGSFSLGGSWKTLRQAGAAAREMLIDAAAIRWKVDRASCSAANSFVVHGTSVRRFPYAELVADAAKLPIPADPPLKKAIDFRLIGKPTKRIDGHNIVTGAARYGIDTKIPGMLYASIERQPWPGAKAKSSQDEKAGKVRGVRLIVPCTNGIAIIAEGTFAALKGRATLAVEWEEPPKDAFDSEAHAKRLEAASREVGFVTRKEGPPAGTGAVTRTIEATYQYPFYAHAPLEVMNCVADVRADRCTIWVPTQAPNSLQEAVADSLGMKTEQVEVNVTLIGGGFGRRLAVDYALEAAELSKTIKAPVQVLWTRADDMKHGHFQAASAHRMSAGLDSNKALVSWQHTKAGSPHNLKRKPGPEAVRDAGFYQDLSWGVYDVPYSIPAIETRYVTVDVAVKHGPWRSVFAPSSVFARESFLDEIAHESGVDPLAFRLDLLKGADIVKAGSLTIDRRRLRQVLEVVREKAEWGKTVEPRHGRGVACNVYDGDTHIAYVVDVAVDESGKVRIEKVVAAVDCGLVVNPIGVEQQIEGGIIWGISSALLGEITFRGGSAQHSTYRDFQVARMHDTPTIEVHIVPSDATTPFGMGEPPVPPIVPAIMNAIFAATGKRIRRLPVSPAQLRA